MRLIKVDTVPTNFCFILTARNKIEWVKTKLRNRGFMAFFFYSRSTKYEILKNKPVFFLKNVCRLSKENKFDKFFSCSNVSSLLYLIIFDFGN